MWQVKDMPERPNGLFDARYRAFLETVSDVRAQLHRYCARMTGSRLDGEDLMQETLFEAYTKIESLDDAHKLKPWLFRIAHNRCIDFLRRRHARERAESSYSSDVGVVVAEPAIDRRPSRHRTAGRPPAAQGARLRPAQGCVRLFAGRDGSARGLDGWRRQIGAVPWTGEARRLAR